MIPNKSLRSYAKERNVPLWKVAQAWGCNDGNFSRKLRVEFSQEQSERFRHIVDELDYAARQEQKGGE